MPSPPQPTLLLIGKDLALGYLLARFAEHSGCQSRVSAEAVSGHALLAFSPAVVIFLSLERLAHGQGCVAELAQAEVPILACVSAAEEAQAREIGADYCLLHPLTYSDFQTALLTVVPLSDKNIWLTGKYSPTGSL